MKSLRIAAIASLALAPAAFAAVPAHAAAEATVSILHAVPGATVDVYANGKALLTNFKPGTLTDPLMLPEGTYDLKVTAAGAGAGGAAVIEAKGVQVPGGANVTVVAHLAEAGKPVLTPFVNDTSRSRPARPGSPSATTRPPPRSTSAPTARSAFKDLTNPNEAKADVAAGTVSADVVLAGTSTVVIGPADLEPQGGHQHDRVRLGQRRGQEPQARGPDHLRHALRPGWRPGRHRRPGRRRAAVGRRRPLRRRRRGRRRRWWPRAHGAPPDGHRPLNRRRPIATDAS